MAHHLGGREHRDAVRAKAMRATGSAEPYTPAVERYLRLESTGGQAAPVAPVVQEERHGYHVSHGHRATGPLRHEHLVINGYEVEVTEDSIGVTELHLE